MRTDKALEYLIHYLSPKTKIPDSIRRKWSLYRHLMNIRKPNPIPRPIINLQDKLLREMIWAGDVTDVDMLEEIAPHLRLYYGDIIFLNVEGIINSADFEKNGYFYPAEDGGLDQVIHIFAGVELRLDIDKRKKENLIVPNSPVMTKGYNLLCSHIFHIELPTADMPPSEEQYAILRDGIGSSLKTAHALGLKSIGIPAIGTGTRNFPKEEALENIIGVVQSFLRNNEMEIVLVANDSETFEMYKKLLKGASYDKPIKTADSAEDLLKLIREEQSKENPEVPKKTVEETLSGLRHKMDKTLLKMNKGGS